MSSSRSFHTLFFLSWSTSWDRYCWHRCLRQFLWRPGFHAAGFSCWWPIPLSRWEPGPGQAGGVQSFCWKHQDREGSGGGRGATGAGALGVTCASSSQVRNSSRALPRQGEAALCPDAAGVLLLSSTHPRALSFPGKQGGPLPAGTEPSSPHSLLSLLPPRQTRPLLAPLGCVKLPFKGNLGTTCCISCSPCSLLQLCSPMAAARGRISSVLPGVFETSGCQEPCCGSPRWLGQQEGG